MKVPTCNNNSFFAALRFLTILPVPGRVGESQHALSGSLPYFPLVGLLLGLIGQGLCLLFWNLFDPFLAAVFTIVALLVFSGGLHLDGLADTADGFFSSRPRERILEIMRDSRVGVMGVIWVGVVFLLKIAALSGMSGHGAGVAVFLMPIAGRCAMLVMMALLPYVRGQNGLASLFYEKAKGWCVCWAIIFLVLISWLSCGVPGLAACGASLGSVLLFSLFCREKIGGATGDTLGAVCELSETAVAITLALKVFS